MSNNFYWRNKKYICKSAEVEVETFDVLDTCKINYLVKFEDGTRCVLPPAIFDRIFVEKLETPKRTCTICGVQFDCNPGYVGLKCWGCITGQEKQT